MKKTRFIAMLLTIAMLLGMFSTVASADFSDISENAVLTWAVNTLASKGIAKGISETEFGADQPVTREQMAAFVYRFMNKGASLENAENTSTFKDLKEPLFYGMIAWANEEGIIKGVSETEFKPVDGIALQDCYTMVLRALGYEENEELSYPDGYIQLAKQLRISENVKETDNKAELTRGDVALILHNALYADMKDGENASTKIYEANPLSGKKVLFIGNSFTYHGYAVMRKSRLVLDIAKRRYDKGYFYQIAKSNGIDLAVTNWTWGGHSLSNIFAEKCTAERECKGLEHLANFTDYDYDYVFLQEKSSLSLSSPEDALKLAEQFRAANPDVKIFQLVPQVGYLNGKHSEEYVATVKEAGITVLEWGQLVADIINGEVKVPGATMEYNNNSFIIEKSADDGYHPNSLTGYITAVMAYCAITGESAVGQDYSFCLDENVHGLFGVDYNLKTYYTYNNATTNYPEIFASESDMKGLQQLVDEYLKK